MELNMTSGSIPRQLMSFSLPIVLGNLFQQLYNTADAMIVGRILGKDAYAAVCVAEPIMSVVLFFMVGLSMGVGVLLAQCYGAGDRKGLKVQYSTALIAGVVFALAAALLCIVLSPLMLRAVQTPAEIIADTGSYLRIIFAGLVFSFLYNYFASALRAIGDSKAAFLFLVISAVVNVVLDLLFVLLTPMGVAGVAVATVLAQVLSGVLCLQYIYKKAPALALRRNEFVFAPAVMKRTIVFSWAAALQQTFLYFGRLMVQGTINAHGTDMIAGYNAAIRLESFFMAFVDGTQNSLATFSGQNQGANKPDRLRRGLLCTIGINWAWTVVVGVILYTLSRPLIGLYVDLNNTEAVKIGVTYTHIMPVPYLLSATMSPIQGFFRGVGRVKITMIATLSQIAIRSVLAIVLVPGLGIYGACISVIIGWLWMLGYDGIMCLKHLARMRAAGGVV